MNSKNYNACIEIGMNAFTPTLVGYPPSPKERKRRSRSGWIKAGRVQDSWKSGEGSKHLASPRTGAIVLRFVVDETLAPHCYQRLRSDKDNNNNKGSEFPYLGFLLIVSLFTFVILEGTRPNATSTMKLTNANVRPIAKITNAKYICGKVMGL